MSRIALLVVATALSVVSTASAANGEPKRAITKADEARAKAVLVTRGDLGQGFKAVRRDQAKLPDDPRCAALAESDLTITGDAESPDFTLESETAFVTVGSTAQVYRSLRDANTSWARGTGANAAACLAALVRSSAGPGQKVDVVSSKVVPFTKVAAKTVAFRLVAKVSVGATRATVYFDAIVVQQGRIQAGIVLTSIGRPVPRTETAALAAVVASRLAKATARGSGPSA